MPELPEVETVKAALLPLLEGRQIKYVRQMRDDLRWPLPERLAKRLEGRVCGTAFRRAKYILIPLDDEEMLLLHLGMSGAIRIHDTQPAFAKHDHLSVQLDTGQWFVFSDPRRFGHIDLINNAELETHKLLHHLGIEPLSNSLSGEWLADRLKGKSAPIKSALMDQRIIAGLGNIYVCEALFKAGISPRRKAYSLGIGRTTKLVTAIREVLVQAIAAGGTSLRDHVQPGGEIGYFIQQLSVYGRADKPCVTCARPVKIITQTGRSSFYCSHCQR